tara:strand:- start:447 stop:1055 length:609 start_codon:yes stop_codon:yes gene_type:complete
MQRIQRQGLFNSNDEYRELYELLKKRMKKFEFYNENLKTLCARYKCFLKPVEKLCIHKHILIKKICQVINVLLFLIFNYPEEENVKKCKSIIEEKIIEFGNIGLKIANIWYFTIFNKNIQIEYEFGEYINVKYYDKKSVKLFKLYRSYQQKKDLIKYFIKILPRIESFHCHNTDAIDIGELIEKSFLRLIYDEYTDACYKRT